MKYIYIIGLIFFFFVPLASADTYSYVSQFGTKGSGNGQFNNPTGICIDSKDHIYVVDNGNNRVEHFSPDGKFLNKFGYAGTKNTAFSNAKYIATDDTYLYITDATQNEVKKFRKSGRFEKAWGSTDNSQGKFDEIEGIAVDSKYVYVADAFNDDLQKFDKNGKFIMKITDTRSFGVEPFGIAVDKSGSVYSVGMFSNNLYKYSCKGKLIAIWDMLDFSQSDGTHSLDGMVLDSAGNIFVTHNSVHPMSPFEKYWISYVMKYDKTGKAIGIIGSETGGYGSGNGQLEFPSDVAVNSKGYVYVVDSGNNRVEVFKKTQTVF